MAGVTNDLRRRVYEHRQGFTNGFTKRYQVHRLVYFEHTEDVNSALAREKQLKNWKRQWKVGLIEKGNPNWSDLLVKLDPGS